MAHISDKSNEIMKTVIEYVCYTYRVDYNGLADMLGMNHGWFTRYRNADFEDKGFNTTFALIRLAASVNEEQLVMALSDEERASTSI